MLETVIIATHVLVSLGIIGFVLLQHGKGADMGASFGSGASATVFGSEGSANFLSRTTAILTAVFFVTSIGLAYYADKKSRPAFVEPAPVTQQNTTAPAHADLIAPAPAANTNIDANATQKPATESTPVPAQTNTTEQPAVESTETPSVPVTQQETTAPVDAELIVPTPATNAVQEPVIENTPASTENTSVPAQTNTIEQPAVESTETPADAK